MSKEINKKVAIITMHKVINFGSALQAWALQTAVEKLGYNCQLIDYKYPNSYYFSHCPKVVSGEQSILKKIRISKLIRWVKTHVLCKRKTQISRFNKFWEKYYHLTKEYSSIGELRQSPPQCDFYVTGSDQVWNPYTMYGDPAFFLAFGPFEIPRISYAASFGKNHIPEIYKKVYSEYLSSYYSLGLREKSGLSIVNDLTGIKGTIVCDPTFLLTKEDYSVLASDSKVKINRPYLLAYILDYAYSPYPAIETIIKQVSEKMGLHVVYLLCGNVNGYKFGSTTISDAGPNEFIRLFSDASFVVTSSFHGTAFASIFSKSFFSVIPASNCDSRISSYLSSIHLEERGIRADQEFILPKQSVMIDYSNVEGKIDLLRQGSLNFLKTNLLKL